MKKLLIVRHGYCDISRRISEDGEKEMANIARFVQLSLKSSSVLILSSSAERASDSARAMDGILNVGFEEIEELWEDEEHSGNIKESCKIIKSRENDAEVIIVVTHTGFTEDLTRFFLKEFGIQDNFGLLDFWCPMAGTGEGFQINIEEGTVKIISGRFIEY